MEPFSIHEVGAAAMLPPRDILVSQWADENRVLTGGAAAERGGPPSAAAAAGEHSRAYGLYCSEETDAPTMQKGERGRGSGGVHE